VLTPHFKCSNIIIKKYTNSVASGVVKITIKNKVLISFRESLGKTIAEMSADIGVSKSYYEKIEYGDRDPGSGFIRKFKARYPEINVDEFFFSSQSHEKCNKAV